MAKDISVALELDSKQFNQGIKQSTTSVKQFGDESKASFAKSAAAAAALAGAFAGLRKGLNVAATFQDLQSSLNTVFGSVDEGAAAFQRVTDIASRTQFQVQDITKAFIQLKASGIEPTEDTILTFARAAAVTIDQLGAFESAIRLLSRSAAGGIGLEELNALDDRGVPVFSILVEKLGLVKDEVNAFSKTAGGTAKIIEALGEGINERFGDALQNRLENTNQRISNFNDQLSILANTALSDTNEGFGELLKNLTETLSNLNSNVEKITKVSDAFIDLAKAIGLLFIGNKIGKFTGSFVTNLGKVNASTLKSATGFSALKTGLTALGRQFGFISMKTAKLSTGARLVLGFGASISGLLTGTAIIMGLVAAFQALNAIFSETPGQFDLMKKEIDIQTRQYDRLSERLTEATERLKHYQEQGDRGKFGGGTSYIDNAQTQVNRLTELLAESKKELTALQDKYNTAAGMVGPPVPLGFERTTNDEKKASKFLDMLDEKIKNVNENFRSVQQFKIYIDSLKELEGEITSNEMWIEYEKRVRAVETAFGMTVESLTPVKTRFQELNDEIAKVDDFETYNAVLGAINQAFNDGDINLEQYKAGVASLGDSFTSAELAMAIFRDAFQDIDTAVSTDLTNALFEGENAIDAMKNTFKEAIKSMIADTIRLMIVQTALQSLFGFFGFGVTFNPSGGIKSLERGKIPGKAMGGPVMKNKPYIVGEKGPELFVPGSSGGIVPNHAMGGTGGQTINYNIQAIDTASFQARIAQDPQFLHAVVSKGANDLPSGRRF
jgi:hypothetical protein